MQIDFNNKLNAGVLSYLEKGTYNDNNKNVSALDYNQTKYDLNAHPDIAELLWKISNKLPLQCNWVLFGTPVLVRPDTGVVFGIADGTRPPLLRFNEINKHNVIQNGGLRQLTNLDGVYADACDIGPEWLYFFTPIKGYEQICYQSFLDAI